MKRIPVPLQPSSPAQPSLPPPGCYLRKYGPASGAWLCACPWDTRRRARATPTEAGGRYKRYSPCSANVRARKSARTLPRPSHSQRRTNPRETRRLPTLPEKRRRWPALRIHCRAVVLPRPSPPPPPLPHTTGIRKEAEGLGQARWREDPRQSRSETGRATIEWHLERPRKEPITSGLPLSVL